ncbi:MAG: DUF924 domain-containing protein [Limnobacter sp.]|nr:DUF924 domain-containing protein [Limnobacter sp.]
MSAPRPQWFVKDPAFDREIEARFGPLIEKALAGDCAHWPGGPRPALALVIVLDQFTRNVFRETPRAFAGDPLALAAARRIVAEGWDRELVPMERWFCYLPFEHSEALADQQESLRLFGQLRDDPQAGGAFQWAQSHHDVIERFGRFPHRNEILGRESTPEEIEFLRQPGSRF